MLALIPVSIACFVFVRETLELYKETRTAIIVAKKQFLPRPFSQINKNRGIQQTFTKPQYQRGRNQCKMAPATLVERLETAPIVDYSQNDNSNAGTFNKASAIALAIALAVAFLNVSFTAVYCFYWRHRKSTRHFQDELEITEDGLKIKKQERRKWFKWGGGNTQDSD